MTQQVYVDPAVTEFAIRLTAATRHPERFGIAAMQPYVAFGASPRGSINLIHAGRALALLRGRKYILPQDVEDLSRDVLRHRLVLTYQALAEGISSDAILDSVLKAVPAPRIDLSDQPHQQAATA
jgi:MoxR-like ATPase